MGILDDLLKRLHRAFDKDPKLAAVIKLTPSQYPASYAVKNGVFTLSVSGSPSFTQSLSHGTIQDLVIAINLFFGFAVTYDDGSPILYDDGTPFFGQVGAAAQVINPVFSCFLAIGLFETVQDLSDDGNLYFPTSMLYNEFQTYSAVLIEQSERRKSAELELYAHTADGSWLDFWLSYFGAFRLGQEGDLAFFTRALADTLSPKVNNQALAMILEKALGFSVEVEDLGSGTVQQFLTNNALSLTNGTAAPDVLYYNLSAHPLSGYFGVYLYAGSINNLTALQKSAVVNLVNKGKASGKAVKYFAPTGQMTTNVSTSLMNNANFATGPVPNGWVEVTI